MNNFLNVIWPAIYISESFWKFWYLIAGTIIIETVILRFALRFDWKKAFLASLAGNIASGVAGTFLMVFGMLGWHLIADFILQGTFSSANWIASYIIMCLGSVVIETVVVNAIYTTGLRRLFLPLLTGNLLTYIFISLTGRLPACA